MIDEVLMQKVVAAREKGQSIGLVQGSWDMFHLGHLCYLQAAAALCDFLIVAMDDDEKIKYRKGNQRPIIPLEERYQFIEKLGLADVIAVKKLDEPHWELIKGIKPDVLIAIKENYTTKEIEQLNEYCGRVAILPRQATTSTSDIVRRTLIKNGVKLPNKNDPRVVQAVEKMKERIGFHDQMEEPIPKLVKYMNNSTDWLVPNAAACLKNGKWYFGTNQIDQSISEYDINNRTELFYSTIEHAEINLLKNLGTIEVLETPVWTTLFPCDKCMKVLISKGVKEIYYLEDHPEKNWSKRSHALAEKKGVKTIQLLADQKEKKQVNFEQYTFIDPRNVRYQEQLEIMLNTEEAGKDPLDPEVIDQDILFFTKYWYVSQNRFPYDEIDKQFLIASLNPIYSVQDISPEMWEDLKLVWDRLVLEHNLQGGAFCQRFGDTSFSGASLKRVHAHVIVPKIHNKTRFTIGGNDVMKRERSLKPNLENK